MLRIRFLPGDVLEDAPHGDGLAFLHQHRAALPDPHRPAIGGNHLVFVAVGLTTGSQVVARLNGFGGVLRLQFLLPKIWFSQPRLRLITENVFTLAADKREPDSIRRALPDDAINRVDQRFHFLLREAERGILALNAAEHLVEGLRKPPQFVAPAAHDGAHRVVLLLTDNLGGPRQLEDGMSNPASQPA